MNHPSKVETLLRAVTDVLAPVAKNLRELGYDAELIATNDDGVVAVKIVVVVEKKMPSP